MEKESINLNCPVAATLQLIGGKYKALLLWHLSGKVLRFNERGLSCGAAEGGVRADGARRKPLPNLAGYVRLG